MSRGILFVFALTIRAWAMLNAQSPSIPDSAQQPSPEPAQTPQVSSLQVTTRLVVLDVVVTDRQGNPVTDLSRDDFNVTEEKASQRIKNFEPPFAHALPSGNLVHSTTDLPKIGDAPVNILVLDELNTRFEDDAFSRFSIEKFLKSQAPTMPPTTLLAANDKSFMVLQDYTQDRPLLEAALKRDPVQYPWRMSRNGGTGPDAVVRLAQSLEVLQSIAQAAAGTPGRKTIIWVGKGFPSVDLTSLDDISAQHLQDAVKRAIDIMLTSRVTLYIVDPESLSGVEYDAETPAHLAVLEEESGDEPFSNAVRFRDMAPTTGGRVFSLRNDVDREIANSLRDGSAYYTLSYTPTGNSSAPGEYRHIRITMNKPGLTATTRDGYYSPSSQADPGDLSSGAKVKAKTGEQVVDVANAALNRLVYNGVKVRAARNDASGRFSLAIAHSSLTWQPSEDGIFSAPIVLVAVCFSANGKVLSHTTEARSLHSKTPNANSDSEEVFSIPIDIPQRTVRVRFVIRDPTTGHLGSADINVK